MDVSIVQALTVNKTQAPSDLAESESVDGQTSTRRTFARVSPQLLQHPRHPLVFKDERFRWLRYRLKRAPICSNYTMFNFSPSEVTRTQVFVFCV